VSEVSEIWGYLDSIQSVLEATGWTKRGDVILCIGALGVLVSTSPLDN
jgi:hypothetical protein